MQNDILAKLRGEIESGITRESQVVYILAGIRKLLEQLDDPEEFDHLKFYCDWALHSKLKGNPAQKILGILEPVYACLLKGEEIPDTSDGCKLSKMEFLQEELSIFLNRFDIKDFSKHGNDWVMFIFLFSRVVEDCPLVIRADNPSKIKNVVVRVQKAAEPIDDHQMYKVNWDFEGQDGLPAGRFFILNSYSITPRGQI